jgi:glycosyltransferase involved in cell wall biosynthesis
LRHSLDEILDVALPSISLVTPTRNQAHYLGETIASVRAQDLAPSEWIVLDAMSADDTPGILARQADLPWVRVIREPDSGQSDAIDKGFRLASGEIVGWLNSDDLLLPGALRAVAEAFVRNPDAVAIHGSGRKIDAAGELLKSVRARPFDAKLLRTALTMLQPATFFRRDAYLAVGGVRHDLDYAMDWELLLRLARHGKIMAIEDELACLRCYPGTKTEAGGWRRLAEIAEIGREYHGPLDPNFVSYRLRRMARGSALARRVVDGVLGRLYPGRQLMVVGWPEEPS